MSDPRLELLTKVQYPNEMMNGSYEYNSPHCTFEFFDKEVGSSESNKFDGECITHYEKWIKITTGWVVIEVPERICAFTYKIEE